MSIKIYISSDPVKLYKKLSEYSKTATVEAEYGDICVEGTEITLAHHGSRWANPAPCAHKNEKIDIEVIGLSHFDLDSLGGVAALLGIKPIDPIFWNLAAFIDVNGVHKLKNWEDHISKTVWPSKVKATVEKLYSWYAWSKNNRKYPPRDGSVEDVTKFVMSAIDIITKICGKDKDLEPKDVLWVFLEMESYLSLNIVLLF